MTETNTDTDTDTDTDTVAPDELHEQAAAMYRRKNDDYGDSWRLAGKTLHLWCDHLDIDSLPTDEQSLISVGLFFQRFHKLTRGFNGEFARDELHHESVFDSHHDESTYAQMHASLFSTDTESDTDTGTDTDETADESASTASTQQTDDVESSYRSKVRLHDDHECTGGYVKEDDKMRPPDTDAKTETNGDNDSDPEQRDDDQPFGVTD